MIIQINFKDCKISAMNRKQNENHSKINAFKRFAFSNLNGHWLTHPGKTHSKSKEKSDNNRTRKLIALKMISLSLLKIHQCIRKLRSQIKARSCSNLKITLSNALTFTLSSCENFLLKFARANDSRKKILSWNRKLKRLIFIRNLQNLEKSVWESKLLLWTSLKPSILMFRMRWISWKQWFNNVD